MLREPMLSSLVERGNESARYVRFSLARSPTRRDSRESALRRVNLVPLVIEFLQLLFNAADRLPLSQCFLEYLLGRLVEYFAEIHAASCFIGDVGEGSKLIQRLLLLDDRLR